MTKHDHLRALARACRHLGGKLAIVSQREFDDLFDNRDIEDDEGLSESPFTSAHGVHWRKKIIYTVRDREEVGSIIHEMGHVFAAPHHPDHDCHECREWDWFGWELVLARQVGASCTWSRHSADYAVTDKGETWGAISPKKRRAVASERLTHAKTIGVVDANGIPRSVR